jgi:hypothetical protein
VTIPAQFQVPSLLQPQQRNPLTDSSGLLTNNGWQTLQGMFGFINGTNRIVPCNASGTNVITLTMLDTSPLVQGYYDFDTYRAVAAATSTGSVTALVATPQGNLGTVKVFKTNGSVQAGAGDITSGLLYDFVYVDSLDSGNGGFVLR